MFLMLMASSWVLVICFVTFQYGRERLFKAEKLNSELQIFNMRVLDYLEHGDSLPDMSELDVSRFADGFTPLDLSGVRVSVITFAGDVVFDNMLDSLPVVNHLDRPEIAQAMTYGTGYTLRRRSETTDDNYFYSAMKGNRYILRSAMPYSLSLRELLVVDSSFLWLMLGLTFLIGIVGYFSTMKIGTTISRLNLFAKKAERGEQISTDERFPHDELGDISNHIVRLYAQLQQATENLHREHQRTLFEEQEKIRIKKQLTNNINHELKTPVASIHACIETLLDHPELPVGKRTEFLERCHSNSERLCSLLNDVSTITRMDEGSRHIEKEPVDLRRIIDECVEENAPRLQERGITLDIIGFASTMPMKGNASLLGSVFRNLIDNAVAYAACSNISIRLVDDNDEACRISFADNGTGIEEKHLPHIFERFYRVDKGRSRKMGGTGLGLSIVNNTVSLHGGVISAANRPEGGLEFVFTLKKNT